MPARSIAGPVIAAILGVVALTVVGCVPGVVLPQRDLLRDVHLRGGGDRPTVALTFDDGPNGRCTEEVLDALAAAGAPATFFVLGANVAAGGNDHLLARMVHEGHTIGVHSWNHAARPLFMHRLAAADLRQALEAITEGLRRGGVAAPPPVRFYRPPFGFVTGPGARAAAEEGLEIVEWTVSVRDWEARRKPTEIAAAILARARPGDVIVLHDGAVAHQRSRERCVDRGAVVEVVRDLLPALRTRGLRPAPLAEVLGLDTTDPRVRTPAPFPSSTLR